VEDVKAKIKIDGRELASRIAVLTRGFGDKEKEYKNAKGIASDPTHPLQEHYIDDLDELKADVGKLGQALKDACQAKADLKDAVLTYEQYLELFDNIANLLGSAESLEAIDEILQTIFSNFIVSAKPDPKNSKRYRWGVTKYNLK
jgi:hypothetical protein